MEKYFILRTQASYSHHCDLIETAQELAEHYSTVYGINYRSPLDSLSNFEFAEGAMIPDIMHDILEGVYITFRNEKYAQGINYWLYL